MTSSSIFSSRSFSNLMNSLGLAGICGVLAMALIWQVVFDEPPCPLCLLQRVAFVMVGIGLLLNMRFGSSPLHYGLILLSSLAGAFAAGRQTLLHIAPLDQGYGSPFLGLHFYTWAFVLFAVLMLWTAMMLIIDRALVGDTQVRISCKFFGWIAWVFFILVAANLISTLLECGFGACPDNPVSYLWLSK